ncbi:MAG: hypothetical protein AB7Y46_08245 [Armatimonadota bacterium]
MSDDRRSFLRKVGRGLAVAVLGGGTGWLAVKDGRPCWSDGACRRCPQLDTCELPEGKLTRHQRLPASLRRGGER